MFEVKIIGYNSREYFNALKVRYAELRKPLGLSYSKELIVPDRDDIHIVCTKADRVIGTLILVPGKQGVIKLRQFAVFKEYQSKGIGSLLYNFAQDYSVKKGYKQISLNARSQVIIFYKKHGFKTEGDEYISPRSFIPHFKMTKVLI